MVAKSATNRSSKRKTGRRKQPGGKKVLRRGKKPERVTDSTWLRDAIADRGLSMRGIAQLAGQNPSRFTRLIQGAQSVTADDVALFANLLGVPADEVLRRFGYAVPAPRVPIVAIVKAGGRVQSVSTSRGDTYSPPGAPPGAQAVQWDASGSHDIYAGATAIVVPAAPGVMPPDAMGRLCLVEPEQPEPLLATVVRSPKRGQIAVRPWGGADIRVLESVRSVAVVTAIYLA